MFKLVGDGYYYNEIRNSINALPLHEAAKNNWIYKVEILSNCTANLNAKDINGRTALHYAALFHRDAAYKILLEKGSDPNLPDVFNCTPADIMKTNEAKSLGECDYVDYFCMIS